MRYPNLVWAIKERWIAHYEVAGSVKVSPSRFSRCLNGIVEFAPHEKTRLSELLGFDAAWLFAEPIPRRVAIDRLAQPNT